MLKSILFRLPVIAVCILATGVFVQSAVAQVEMTANQWRTDLRFLQKTIHDDYPFLFKKVTADQFDLEVEKLFKAIPDLQEHEVAAGLSRLVAMFGYGHTRLGIERSSLRFHQIPLNLYEFSDGIYVQGVHKDYKESLGAKVIEVEGILVGKALKLVRPMVPVENDQYMKAHGLRYLCTPEVLHAQGVTKELKSDVTFKLERDGKPFEQKFVGQVGLRVPVKYGMVGQSDQWLDSREQGEPPLYLKNLNKIYFFEYLPEHKTVYVRHSQIQDEADEPIPQFYDRVFEFVEKNDVARLVLDVRLNGGGNNYKNKPIVTGVIRCEKINQPGKFFVITGRRTFSACQNLVNELDTYTNAVFVGEPTSENINFYGDNRQVVLPNSKIPAFLSFAWWQDKPQWENHPWLAPKIAVDSSFDDYRSNRDPVLAAILDHSGEVLIHDPIEHLKQLFLAGKKGELETTAKSMIGDTRYQHVDFESEFNQAGYDLLRQDQSKQAIEVFTFNTRIFPESANAWDSLAESYMNSGKKELAIKFYNKSIELDPNGETGTNSRQMLKQLNSDNSSKNKAP